MQEAGATADLELAYTLADGVEDVRAGERVYVQWAEDAALVLAEEREGTGS